MVGDYIAAVLADSPRAFWKLQDIADYPQDSSGNGLDMDSKAGTPTYGNVAPQPPRGGWSVGVSRAALALSSSPSSVVDNLTLECWLRIASSTTGDVGIFGGSSTSLPFSGSSPSDGYWAAISASAPKLILHTASGGSGFLANGALSVTTTASGNVSGWNHLVVLRRAGTWEAWVNGTKDTGIGSFIATPAAAPAMWLGGVGTTLDNFSGNFQFYAFYEVALTATRIAAHYSAMIAWDRAYVRQDEDPTGLLGGPFTTADPSQGLVADRPPHHADYNELSWLGTGSADVEYAQGGGASAST